MQTNNFTYSRLYMLLVLTVVLLADHPLMAQTHSFSNAAPIVIPFNDVQGDGVSDPYPSVLVVSNLTGTVASVTLTLHGLTHASAKDLDMLLVSPDAATVVFYSGAGNDGGGIENIDLTLDDAASQVLPDQSSLLVSGTYKPTQYFFQEDYSFNEGGIYTNIPDGPYGTTMAAVTGGDPNGAWLLFIDDNSEGFTGVLSNGWSLAITLNAGDLPPVFDTVDPQAVIVGSNLMFEVVANDTADNDFIDLTASNLPPGAVFAATNGNGAAAGTLVWENAGPEGVYTSVFYAADADGVVSQVVVIRVTAVPLPTLDILAMEASGGQLVIRWESEPTRNYRVLVSTNLLDPDGFTEMVNNIAGNFLETSITTTPTAVFSVYKVIGEELFVPPPFP